MKPYLKSASSSRCATGLRERPLSTTSGQQSQHFVNLHEHFTKLPPLRRDGSDTHACLQLLRNNARP